MRLQIATQNVWGLPEPFAHDLIPRMRGLAQALMSCSEDIFVFQEAWSQKVRRILRKGGRRAGFLHHWSPPGGIGGGLLILSRLPFDQPRFEPYRFTGTLGRLNHGEVLGGKGFAIVRLRTERGPVWLVNTHLHASYTSPRRFMENAVRTTQLLQLVDSLPVSGEPMIVAGDFNCSESDSEYLLWKQLSGMRDAALAFDHPQNTISADNFYKRDLKHADQRIDYAFIRDGSELALEPIAVKRIFDQPLALVDGQEVQSRPISDHFGVSFTFDLQAQTPRKATASHPATGPNVISMTRQLLANARAEIDREETAQDHMAASFLVLAGGAELVRSSRRVTRRGLLHRALGLAGLVALGPAVALKAVARSDAERQRLAFTAASEMLAKLDPAGDGRVRPDLTSLVRTTARKPT